MDEQRFWDILAAASGRVTAKPDWFCGEMFQTLQGELSGLSPDEIFEFSGLFDAKVDAAYRLDLWGAASLINDGCSDDGFHAFRCWLVGRGREVYSRALADPDTLADVLDGEGPWEASLDVAPARAWEAKTGRTDAEFYDEKEKLGPTPALPDEGEDWDFEDEAEMRRRLPRLSALYLSESED